MRLALWLVIACLALATSAWAGTAVIPGSTGGAGTFTSITIPPVSGQGSVWTFSENPAGGSSYIQEGIPSNINITANHDCMYNANGKRPLLCNLHPVSMIAFTGGTGNAACTNYGFTQARWTQECVAPVAGVATSCVWRAGSTAIGTGTEGIAHCE